MSDKIEPKAFVFNTAAATVAAVEIEFADGRQLVPDWLVAHLGGVEKVTSPASLEAAKRFTYADFLQRFHHKVSSSALESMGKQIVRDHMNSLARAQRRMPWERR